METNKAAKRTPLALGVKTAKRTVLALGVSAAIGAVALGVATSTSPAATTPAHHSQTEVRQGQTVNAALLIPVSQRGAQDNRARLVR